MIRIRKMRASTVSIGIFFCLFAGALSAKADRLVRHLYVETQNNICSCRTGKIFYVTTTTSISTVNSVEFCYVLSAPATPLITCARRRRRMLSEASSDVQTEDISPSASDIESSQEDMEERHGRFVNYWITTTFTSTKTAYTATSTLKSIYCTPNGFTYNNCPGDAAG